MMKIYLGSAGIPTVAKDRSTIGGIRCIAELGLSALEVQFVRQVAMSIGMAKEVGKVAGELGVKLSVHGPYAINLCSAEEAKVEASKKRILDSALRAQAMGADIVVLHPGYYGSLSPKEAFKKVKEACVDLANKFKKAGIEGVRIGLETTGKVSQFGELEEIAGICKEVESCCPVVDFAHIYSRQGGRIDYGKIFDELQKLKLKHLHSHYTGVEFSPVGATGKGNERYHLELKANRPPFEPLAKEIIKRKLDITIISESPILEQDSLKMKAIFERLGYRF